MAPALGFVVSDHLPALDLTATHSTPEWGAPAQLAATLTSSSGAPLLGAIVRLDLLDGGKWRQLRLGVTDGPGSALFDVAAESRTTLRATFTPPAGQAADRTYLGVQSRSLTVTPHVRLTPPTLPATVRVNDLVTVAGYLAPLHTAGGNSVDLVFQRRGAGGAWVTKLTVDAMNRDAGSQTHYVGSVRLPAAGTWRVQATHPPDGEHAQTYSTWRSFTVK